VSRNCEGGAFCSSIHSPNHDLQKNQCKGREFLYQMPPPYGTILDATTEKTKKDSRPLLCVEFCPTYFLVTPPMNSSVHEFPPRGFFLNGSHCREAGHCIACRKQEGQHLAPLLRNKFYRNAMSANIARSSNLSE
jgi:hypothetical protein